MFSERGGNRRRAYSFRNHFQRIARAKGWRYLLSALIATLSLTGVVLASCEGSRITGPQAVGKPHLDLLPSAPEMSASEKIPLTFDDPCTGELVSGTYENRISATEGLDHLTIHGKMTFSGTGIDRVTGLAKSTTYNGSEEDMYEVNTPFDGHYEQTNVVNMRVLARNAPLGESEDDFFLHADNHITVVVPGGGVKALTDHFYVDCK
jgi:hypothetical protein